MSRCFPFPPPGYERKTKTDHSELLKKALRRHAYVQGAAKTMQRNREEKSKEKKHKKEKKDKEKKEGKEKREKERHREKKDKKEKSRDKRKDREKDRAEKHKSDPLLSGKKKVAGSIESHATNISKSKEREDNKNATSAEKKVAVVSGVRNGMPPSKNNNYRVSGFHSFNNIPDLGRKNMDEDRRTTNHNPPDKNVAERKKDAGIKLATRSGMSLQDAKDRTNEKPVLDGLGIFGDARSSDSPLVSHSVGLFPNSVGMFPNSGMLQNRNEGTPKPLEKKMEHKMDGKEKVREKEGHDRKGDRRKEKDREKPVLKDRDKDKDKEEKKEEIMKPTPEVNHLQVTRIKDGNENHMKSGAKDGFKKDILSVQSVGLHNITKDINHHAASVNNNPMKRKDPGLNGVYDEHITRPNKLARKAPPHPLTENGRSLEPCQNSSAAFLPGPQRSPMNIKVGRSMSHDDTLQQSMDMEVECNLTHGHAQRPHMKIKVDGKECKINGTVAESSSESCRETTAKVERNPDAPAKLSPHPDTKYLSQILSVPKLDEPDYDDEEWLFNSNSSSTREPEVEPSGIDETPQLWARALWLKPIDVYALPYVIPH